VHSQNLLRPSLLRIQDAPCSSQRLHLKEHWLSLWCWLTPVEQLFSLGRLGSVLVVESPDVPEAQLVVRWEHNMAQLELLELNNHRLQRRVNCGMRVKSAQHKVLASHHAVAEPAAVFQFLMLFVHLACSVNHLSFLKVLLSQEVCFAAKRPRLRTMKEFPENYIFRPYCLDVFRLKP